MNKKIRGLNSSLETAKGSTAAIESQLQTAWNEIFDNMVHLQDVINKLHSSQEYGLDENGDIISYIRFNTSDFKDCQEYLNNYLQDNHCVSIDFDNDSLSISHGDDNIVIQDDTRHDNGVWQDRKLIIEESLYKDDDGNIDEDKRNELIEAHMNRTGYFAGVFRIDSHGNVFLVDTT